MSPCFAECSDFRNLSSDLQDTASVTGSELKQLREDLGQAIGKSLSAADMAKLCGLDRYPILENFNVFDRFNIHEKERPARRAAFRENMRDEIRRRLG